jgi:toxin ParE1/3/4
MADYLLPPAAEGDLEIIWEHTYQQWGIDQAHRYIDILFAAFAELAESPKSSPACDHIRQGYRRRSVERHMIYYRISDDGIVIVRILHDRMDAPRYI